MEQSVGRSHRVIDIARSLRVVYRFYRLARRLSAGPAPDRFQPPARHDGDFVINSAVSLWIVIVVRGRRQRQRHNRRQN